MNFTVEDTQFLFRSLVYLTCGRGCWLLNIILFMDCGDRSPGSAGNVEEMNLTKCEGDGMSEPGELVKVSRRKKK